MPPKSSLRADRAVAKVLARKCTATEAAEAVGLAPHAVQNIRKRVREERGRREDAALAARALETAKKKAKKARTASIAPATKEKLVCAGRRHTAHQVDGTNKAKHTLRRATIGAYKAATLDYQELPKKKRKRGDGGAGAAMPKENGAPGALVPHLNPEHMHTRKRIQTRTCRDTRARTHTCTSPHIPTQLWATTSSVPWCTRQETRRKGDRGSSW